MPKWLMWALVVVVVGIAGFLMCRTPVVHPLVGGGGASIDTVAVGDSLGVYMVQSFKKLVKLKKANGDQVLWTFHPKPPPPSVDSVVAIFNPNAGQHPFLSTRFEFSTAPRLSDSIVVAPNILHIYVYRITIYYHPYPDTVNVDPGIIIE